MSVSEFSYQDDGDAELWSPVNQPVVQNFPVQYHAPWQQMQQPPVGLQAAGLGAANPTPPNVPMMPPQQFAPDHPIWQHPAMSVSSPSANNNSRDPFLGHRNDSTFVIPTLKGEARFSVQGFHWLRLHGSQKLKDPKDVETIKAPKIRLGGHDYWLEFLPNRDCLSPDYNGDMFVSVCLTDVEKQSDDEKSNFDLHSCNSFNSSSCSSTSSPKQQKNNATSKKPIMPRYGTVQITVKVVQNGEDKHLVDCGYHSMKFEEGKANLGFALMSPCLNQATELLFYVCLTVVTGDGAWVTSNGAAENDMVSQHVPKSVCEDFNDLRLSGTGADASILTDCGQKRAVHSCILSARSAVFRTMFRSGLKESFGGKVIKMEGISAKTLDRFLEFIYSGHISTQLVNGFLEPWLVDDCMDLASVAHRYDVPSLIETTISKLTRLLSAENVAAILQFADRYSFGSLKSAACNFATKNPEVLLKMQASPEFGKLDSECLRALISAKASRPRLDSGESSANARGIKRNRSEAPQ
eukprot:gene90-827_t